MKTNTAKTIDAKAITMALNAERNGVELTFGEKPSEDVRNSLKSVGFRWHSQRKLWYAKQNAETIGLAEKLTGASPKAKKATSKKASPKAKKASTAKAQPKAEKAQPKAVKAETKAQPKAESTKAKASKKPAKKAQPKAEELKTIAYKGASKPKVSAKLIKALNETEGLTAELDREWLWVSGDTKPYRESLKALGFHYSGKRQAWWLA